MFVHRSASGCENGLCTPSVTGPSAGQQGGRAVWLCKHILFYLRVQGMFGVTPHRMLALQEHGQHKSEC